MEPALDDRTEADKLYELAEKLVVTKFTRERMPIYEEMLRLIRNAQQRDAATLATFKTK